MGLNYTDLTTVTREAMLKEIDLDGAGLYISPNLTPEGANLYPTWLRDAARSGTDESLASAIEPHLMATETSRQKSPGGRPFAPVMRSNAHTMLAEGQFNRFYMRAIALRATREGKKVFVYRAKEVDEERSTSRHLIGQELNPHDVLADLRLPPKDQKLGLARPNSGISLRLQ